MHLPGVGSRIDYITVNGEVNALKPVGGAAHTSLWLVGALLLACSPPPAAPENGVPTPTPAITAGATPGDATTADITSPTAVPTPPFASLPPVGSKLGNTAPDFTLELDTGPRVSLASLRDQGRPVVLYFFTTW